MVVGAWQAHLEETGRLRVPFLLWSSVPRIQDTQTHLEWNQDRDVVWERKHGNLTLPSLYRLGLKRTVPWPVVKRLTNMGP